MKSFIVWLFFILSGLAFSVAAEEIKPVPGAVSIDPNCLESREVCEKKALEREARVKRCQENPQSCEQERLERMQQQEKRKKFCQENPAVCKKQHEERVALETQCKAQPEQCAELKKQFNRKKNEERTLAFEQWCTNNAKSCEKWKAESKKIQEQCAEMRKQLKQKFPDMP